MRHTNITSIITGSLVSAVLLMGAVAAQASTTPVDPSVKLQDAVLKLEAKLSADYATLTLEQQDTILATRFKNTNTAIKDAKKAVLAAETALNSLAYGDPNVKSQVQLQLSNMYAQLYSYQIQVNQIQKANTRTNQPISDELANTELTGVLNEALAYLQANKATYATILAEVLANQDSAALTRVGKNLTTLNTIVSSYSATGARVSTVSNLAGKAASNYSLASTLYSAGLKETDLTKQIYDFNEAGRYLVTAQAQIVAAERALGGLER